MASKKEKFTETHTLKTFYIKNELWTQFDALAAVFGHGSKTELINEAIELVLAHYKKQE